MNGTDEQVAVRPRLPADLDRCAEVLVRVHALDGYPAEGVADPRGRLSPDGLLAAWVAVAGGEVVGHVALTVPSRGDRDELGRLVSSVAGPVGLLCRLFVAPEARGGGAGRRLVEAAAAHAESRGLALVLDVMLKDAAAIRLYERLGWRHLGDSVHDGGPAGTTPCRWYAWQPR